MSNENDKMNIETAIKRLEEKRDAITLAINELRALAGLEPESQRFMIPTVEEYVQVQQAQSPTEVRPDTFFGMNTPTAAKKYLDMVKRPKSTKEIAGALLEGGVLSRSKNFSAIVHTALTRDQAFVRIKGGKWALSGWYPGQGRVKQGKMDKDSKQDFGEGEG